MASITENLKRLRPKQLAYVRNRAKGMTKKQAALKAGYSAMTAKDQTTRIEDNPDVRAVFGELVRRACPPAELARGIAEGIKAETVEWAKHEGQFVDSRKHVNWSERRAYISLAAEYGGYVMHDQGPATVIGISFTPPVNLSTLKSAQPAVEPVSQPPSLPEPPKA